MAQPTGVRVELNAASALSTAADTPAAVHDAAGRVASQLGPAADLAVVFCSPHHLTGTELISEAVRATLHPRVLIGCVGEWIVGEGREIEDAPAVSVWAATLPGAGLRSFHSRFARTTEGSGFVGFPDLKTIEDVRAVVMVADPYSFPADALLRLAAARFGAVPFIGGMASGGREPGETALFCDEDVHRSGAVGVVLTGPVPLRTIVSQGCRPIGPSFVVTRAEENVIHELGGQPALERVRNALVKLDPTEQTLAARGLHIGIVIDEQKETFERGDFLIRAVVGADAEKGSIVVGDVVDVGRTVQLHVRDAETADEDLREMLGTVPRPPAGGLLFTCNGRGSRMFDVPDHDIGVIRDSVGDIPVAGFFCQGEIGPVGGTSFLHGFTASAAFFG